jgi:hypothetical protein
MARWDRQCREDHRCPVFFTLEPQDLQKHHLHPPPFVSGLVPLPQLSAILEPLPLYKLPSVPPEPTVTSSSHVKEATDLLRTSPTLGRVAHLHGVPFSLRLAPEHPPISGPGCAFPRMLGPLPTRGLLPSVLLLLLPRKPGEVECAWRSAALSRRHWACSAPRAGFGGGADTSSLARRRSRPPRHRWRLRLPRAAGGASPSAAAAAATQVVRAARGAQHGSARRRAPRRPQARARGGSRPCGAAGAAAALLARPAAGAAEAPGAPRSPRSPRSRAGGAALAALGGAAGPGAAHSRREPPRPRRSPCSPPASPVPRPRSDNKSGRCCSWARSGPCPEAGRRRARLSLD